MSMQGEELWNERPPSTAKSGKLFGSLTSVFSPVASTQGSITAFIQGPSISLATIRRMEELEESQKAKSNSVAVVVRRGLKGLQSSLDSEYHMTVAELIEFGSKSFSDEESGMSYRSISQSWTPTNSNFFTTLGEVPTVESVDPSEAWGRFTNPLTGSPVHSSTEYSYESFDGEQEEEYGGEEEDKEDDTSMEFSFEDFDSRYPKDIIVKAPSEEEGIFFEQLPTTSFDWNVGGPVKFIKSMVVESASDIVQSFLHELISEVARLCEESQERHTFEEKLDKKAMFKAILKADIQLYEERKAWVFLNRKGVEFFRRKGKHRFYASDISEDSGEAEIRKYKETIAHLDEILGAESRIERNTDRMQDIAMIADEEEENAGDEIKKFEKMVKTVLKCEPDSRLAEVVNECLHSMAVLRDEISKVRVILIRRQQALETLRKEIDELNDLGQGLTLLKYENLEIETRALGKKIEDRKTMLARQHDRFHTSLHTMAHINFSRGILNMKLRNQTSILDQLVSEKDEMRKQVHQLNLFHERRRKEINDLLFKSGLLAKPALLTDYDATMKNIEEKRKSVEQLRQTKMDIEAKLKKSEKTSTSYRIR